MAKAEVTVRVTPNEFEIIASALAEAATNAEGASHDSERSAAERHDARARSVDCATLRTKLRNGGAL